MKAPTTIRGLVLLVLLAVLAPLSAPAEVPGLDWRIDGPVLGAGALLVGAGELLLPELAPPWGPLPAPDLSTINGLDRAAMFPYSHGADLASTVLEYGTPAATLALVFLAAPLDDAFPLAVVYLESISLAVGVKNAVNYLLPRWRPYVYEGGAAGVSATEDRRSFPSGHTTLAFAAATAGVTLFYRYAPESPLFVPFVVASYGLAAATGTLRIVAGMHFVTDVLAGAAIGTLFGWFVPTLHDRLVSARANRVGLGLDVDARGVMLSWSY